MPLPGRRRGDDDRLATRAQPRQGALLLRAAQRQAARLLGHGRRPAVQDPQQPEPPGRLPPAAAVRAADRPGAAGRAPPRPASTSAPIVNGLNQPLPLVRFQLLVQKAAEICQEVKSLGSSLLSAMEKEDGEALAILRARHERVVLEHGRARAVRPAAGGDQGEGRRCMQSLALARAALHLLRAAAGQQADEIAKAIPSSTTLDADAWTR